MPEECCLSNSDLVLSKSFGLTKWLQGPVLMLLSQVLLNRSILIPRAEFTLGLFFCDKIQL